MKPSPMIVSSVSSSSNARTSRFGRRERLGSWDVRNRVMPEERPAFPACSSHRRKHMAKRSSKKSSRRYSRSASEDVEKEMHDYKRGKARSGPGGRGGKVKSRKQAIAIGLSKARSEGKKVPKRSSKTRSAKKRK